MLRIAKQVNGGAVSLAVTERFEVEARGLTLEEKNSQCTLTLGPTAPRDIAVGEWMRENEAPGAGIVWRVRKIEDDYVTDTRTVTLEHIVQALKDTSIFGSVGADDMGGTDGMVGARAAINYALARQSDFVLGDFGYDAVTGGYSFNGDTVFAAIENVCRTLDDCWWAYDLSVYPFRIHIVQRSRAMACEMRGGRNISSIRRTLDMSRMYTRIYPIGKDDLHISGNYLSANENVYGVVEKVETESSIEDTATLTAWAQARLNRHCEPELSVTISGLDLSAETGEPLDALTVGVGCRVPLPEFNTTILETITRMVWRDAKRDPTSVTVTLANNLTDVTMILREEISSGSGTSGSAGRRSATQSKEDHAWFVDTEDHVGMVAEAIGGLDENGNPNWSNVASSIVDGKGIHDRVVYTEGEVVNLYTAIDTTSTNFHMELVNVVSGLQGDIEVTAAGLKTEFDAADSTLYTAIIQTATNFAIDLGNAQSDLYGHIEVTAGGLRTDFDAADSTLYTAIIQTATNFAVELGNAQSDLYGHIEVTAEGLEADFAAADSLLYLAIDATATNFNVDLGNVQEGLESSISAQAGRIDLVVSGTGSNASIRPAQIVASINSATKSSEVLLSADRVTLSGTTTIEDVMTVDSYGTRIKNALTIGDASSTTHSFVQVNNGTITATTYSVPTYGKIRFTGTGTGEYYDIDLSQIKTMIKSADVRNNVLTLTPFYGDAINFSKATTLTGEKSSGSGTTGEYTFTATQTNLNTRTNTYETTTVATKTIGFTQTADYRLTMSANGSATAAANPKMAIVPVKISPYTSGQETADPIYTTTVTANVEESWNAGYDTARGYISWPETAADGKTSFTSDFTVLTPNAARTAGDEEHTFTMTSGTPGVSGYAAVTLGGYTVAQLDISNWYRSGSAAVTLASSWVHAMTNDASAVTWDNNEIWATTSGRVNSSGTADERNLHWKIYVTSDDDVAYARLASSIGQYIAKIEHGKYSAGRTVGQGEGQTAAGVSGSWSNNTYTANRELSSSTKTVTTTIGTRFGVNSGTYYIEAYEGEGTSIGNTSVTYQLGTSGSTTSTKVQVQNASGTRIADTPELDVGTLYSDGQTAAGVSGAWVFNTFYANRELSAEDKTVTTTIGTRFGVNSGTYYIEAYEGEGTSIGNTSVTYQLGTSGSTTSTKVQVQNASGTRIADTPELDVGTLYSDGQTAAGVSGSWANNTYTASRELSNSTKSVSTTIGTRFNVNSGTYYIEAYQGSNTAIGNTSVTYKLGTSGSTSSTKVQIQNASGTRIANTPELSVGSLYTDGWTGCYTSLGANATATKTLDYGEAAYVLVTAVDSAGTTQTYLERTYTAPADRYSDGQTAAGVSGSWVWNTFYANRELSSSTKSLTTTIGTRFGVNSGTYYIEAYEGEGTSIGNTSVTYQLGTSGSTTSTKVQVQNASGTRIADTPELSVGTLYSDGYTAGAENTWFYDLSNTNTTGWSNQGTLSYGQKIGLMYSPYGGGSPVYREYYWTAPPDNSGGGSSESHSPSLTVTTGWTGSIAGRTNKGSATASSLARTYMLFDVTCGNQTNKYYFVLN